MNNTFGIRHYFLAGRTFVTALLGCLLFLSASGPIALLGLAGSAANVVPTSESESEETDANELDAIARVAEIWVSGNDAPLISVGRQVRLQFEGWPAVQFTGWPSVAVGTFGGKVSNVDAAAGNSKNQFRVLVVPDEVSPPWPSTKFLRQGTRANGWMLLDQVGLGYEAWRRLNGFPPTVAFPKPSSDGIKQDKGK